MLQLKNYLIEKISNNNLIFLKKIYNKITLIKTIRLSINKNFDFNNQKIAHYLRGKNINFPPFRMTERSIELALADDFISQYEYGEVAEVGAVTPYYWPNRVKTVIDPYDKHQLVTHKEDWLLHKNDYRSIVSISTFEHIGLADYGLDLNLQNNAKAIEKLINSHSDFLVTWPGGYNKFLDENVINKSREFKSIHLYAWLRNKHGNSWVQVKDLSKLTDKLVYGPYWANVLFVLYRGPGLFKDLKNK
jgi:hypothetical protein